MLTTYHYYRYYLPYMIKQSDGANALSLFNDRMPAFQLNTAYKDDVIRYERQVFAYLTGFFNACGNLMNQIMFFERNADFFGYEETRELLISDLNSFAYQSYNVTDFVINAEGSPTLNQFGQFLRDFSAENAALINMITNASYGLTNVVFIEDLSPNELYDFVSTDLHIFVETLYEAAREALRLPLAAHMAFPRLGCYYSYCFNFGNDRAFSLVEYGMLYNNYL